MSVLFAFLKKLIQMFFFLPVHFIDLENCQNVLPRLGQNARHQECAPVTRRFYTFDVCASHFLLPSINTANGKFEQKASTNNNVEK